MYIFFAFRIYRLSCVLSRHKYVEVRTSEPQCTCSVAYSRSLVVTPWTVAISRARMLE